jgi:dipeptidase D
MGGHSGEDINKGRANANVLMGRILKALSEEQEIRLVRINGGSKDNAIPRACEAILAVENADLAIDRITELVAAEAETLSLEDRGFQVVCESSEPECCMMTSADSERVIRLLSGVPNGVLQMSRSVDGLVEFSRNMGVVRCEDGSLTVTFSSRSAIEAQIDESMEKLERLAEATGCEIGHRGRYPGWEYAEKSALRDAYLQTFEEVTGERATVNVIHAGLECGVICSRIREMDIISVGPTMQDIHSPSEALDLDSTEIFWRVLETLIPRL